YNIFNSFVTWIINVLGIQKSDSFHIKKNRFPSSYFQLHYIKN
ncbi:undecaprenyl-diphosphatase, partial [Bacillus cereus]|nr:undecaprenyl-diphosphatase [Bacillus cereus]